MESGHGFRLQCISETNADMGQNESSRDSKGGKFLWSSNSISFVHLKVNNYLFTVMRL